MEYSFKFNSFGHYCTLFKHPYERLIELSAHNWTSARVEKDIVGTQNVMNGQMPEYIWGSEAVYLVTTSSGTTVYDSFDKDETPLFTITNQEVLKFLQDFKAFLQSQGV